MRKIKSGDIVEAITGKDKTRRGKVIRVYLKTTKKHGRKITQDLFALVEGLNLVKKHEKANPQLQKPGGIKTKEAPIRISNIRIVNQQTGKPDGVNIKTLEDGKKVRIFKSTGEVVDA